MLTEKCQGTVKEESMAGFGEIGKDNRFSETW